MAYRKLFREKTKSSLETTIPKGWEGGKGVEVPPHSSRARSEYCEFRNGGTVLYATILQYILVLGGSPPEHCMSSVYSKLCRIGGNERNAMASSLCHLSASTL